MAQLAKICFENSVENVLFVISESETLRKKLQLRFKINVPIIGNSNFNHHSHLNLLEKKKKLAIFKMNKRLIEMTWIYNALRFHYIKNVLFQFTRWNSRLKSSFVMIDYSDWPVTLLHRNRYLSTDNQNGVEFLFAQVIWKYPTSAED